MIWWRDVQGDEQVDVSLASLVSHLELVHSGETCGQTLDVWLLDTEDLAGEMGTDVSVLDEIERQNAAALKTPRLRRRYEFAHVALRVLLGRALDLPARDVRIVRGACPRCGASGARPVLSQSKPELHFSLSSSEQLVLIGLASAAVGVDVQMIPSLRAVDEASELLHPGERAELLALTPESRRAVFTVLWSRKEAHLKGMGVGMAHELVGEYMGIGPRIAFPQGWTVLDISVPSGFFASAALNTG